MEFRYGYVKYSLSLSYKGMDNGRYVYTGFEIGNMAEAIVMTSTKLSRFLDNYGQMQSETFEKDKLIELHISGSGSLSVYPIKDTPERRKRVEEKVAKQEAENTARNKLEELYPYGVQYLQDSLKQQVVRSSSTILVRLNHLIYNPILSILILLLLTLINRLRSFKKMKLF